MVSVSRGAEEPSCFLVVVAESVESIEKSSEAAAQSPAFLITVHQRRRRRELAERVLSWPEECSKWNKFKELRERGAAPRWQYMPLDNCRYNEYYLFVRTTQEVGHDGHPQKQGTRAHEPRLAEFAFHIFVCRLFRSRACAVPHAARDERRPGRGRRWFPQASAPRHGNRDLRARRRAGTQRQHGQRLGHHTG